MVDSAKLSSRRFTDARLEDRVGLGFGFGVGIRGEVRTGGWFRIGICSPFRGVGVFKSCRCATSLDILAL
eukprot:1344237-Amorphochlora_amoeboformis.AAC.1